MSASTIKTAVAALLTGHVTTLDKVHTAYPALDLPGAVQPHMQTAVVWDAGFRETREAGAPQTGIKRLEWRIVTHLLFFGGSTGSGGEDADGATFDTLVEAVLELYRAHPTLDGAADTATSQVIFFAQDMALDKPPPDLSDQVALYQAAITCTCAELVRG